MEVEQVQRKLNDLTSNLLKEGILDEQFRQLLRLQLSKPLFVFDIISLYLRESEKIINNLHTILEEKTVDFNKVDAQAFQLKGSSVSIGAQRVKDACEAILNCCRENNQEGCLKSLQQLKQEHSLLKSKLEPLSPLEQEIVALVGSTQKVNKC